MKGELMQSLGTTSNSIRRANNKDFLIK